MTIKSIHLIYSLNHFIAIVLYLTLINTFINILIGVRVRERVALNHFVLWIKPLNICPHSDVLLHDQL